MESKDLRNLINQYFEENLIGEFNESDSELVKEIIRDFHENYYINEKVKSCNYLDTLNWVHLRYNCIR